MEPIIYKKCPVCNLEMETEGIDNGIGYVYPPFFCGNCGWTEKCGLYNTENCTKDCTEYEKCYEDLKTIENI